MLIQDDPCDFLSIISICIYPRKCNSDLCLLVINLSFLQNTIISKARSQNYVLEVIRILLTVDFLIS